MSSADNVSNAELEILKVLWCREPQNASSIISQLQLEHDWHEKTIRTLLNRLVSKGVLSFERQGRAYLYSSRITQAEYQNHVSTKLVDKIFSGRISPLVAGFAQSGRLQDEDIESLKALIAQWEKGDDNV